MHTNKNTKTAKSHGYESKSSDPDGSDSWELWMLEADFPTNVSECWRGLTPEISLQGISGKTGNETPVGLLV